MSRRFKVIVCRGPECGSRRDSKALHGAFDELVRGGRLGVAVELGWQSCFGRCSQGPNILVAELAEGPATEQRFLFATLPTGRPARSALYNRCSPADVAEIVRQHIVGGTIVRRLIQPVAPRAPVVRQAATTEPAENRVATAEAPSGGRDGED